MGLPVAVAPGMGLNAYFAYGLVLGQGFSGNRRWQSCLWRPYCSFCFPCRDCAAADRRHSRQPAPWHTAGIGLFLAMIGLQGMGLVVDDPDTLRVLAIWESGRTDEPGCW